MGAEIREARRQEAAAIVPLYEWLFEAPGSVPPSWDPVLAEQRLEAAIEGAGSTVILALDDIGICGFATAYIDIESVRFGTRCWVEDLAIHPERRSRGTGAGILAAARDWARAHGASHLELDSSDARSDAHRFYEREGGDGASRSFAWRL